MINYFLNIFKKSTTKDKTLIRVVTSIAGSRPRNLDLFRLASQHLSIAKKNAEGIKESNERLEYLGDAVLSAVVADYLFKKYPFKDEGFLTQIRSRIVNRESLNALGKKIGLDRFVEYDGRNKHKLSHKSLYGDTLEAFIGAVYLDRGFKHCQKFILRKLIVPHCDLQSIIDSDTNFKSKLVEWSQKENKSLAFNIVSAKRVGNHNEFTAEVIVEEKEKGKGFGYSKKKAEQAAAKNALLEMGLIEET